MNQLDIFPKKLLYISFILILVFVAAVIFSSIYHPQVPIPHKFSFSIKNVNISKKNAYYVEVNGLPENVDTLTKVKVFLNGEQNFGELIVCNKHSSDKCNNLLLFNKDISITPNMVYSALFYTKIKSKESLLLLMFK